jgi:hypothetical protein
MPLTPCHRRAEESSWPVYSVTRHSHGARTLPGTLAVGRTVCHKAWQKKQRRSQRVFETKMGAKHSFCCSWRPIFVTITANLCDNAGFFGDERPLGSAAIVSYGLFVQVCRAFPEAGSLCRWCLFEAKRPILLAKRPTFLAKHSSPRPLRSFGGRKIFISTRKWGWSSPTKPMWNSLFFLALATIRISKAHNEPSTKYVRHLRNDEWLRSWRRPPPSTSGRYKSA